MKTLEIIEYLDPKHFVIENPQTGLLKNQYFMYGIPYKDIDYCKYGMPYRKKHDYGIMYSTGYLRNYVKKTVVILLTTNIMQQLKEDQVNIC